MLQRSYQTLIFGKKINPESTMLKLSHAKMVFISGLVWFGVGVYLLQLGLNLLVSGVNSPIEDTSLNYPLLHFISQHVGSIETAAIFLIVCALFVGYFKGRYVLGKSANRGVARIQTFPNPMNLSDIYSAKYYVLLGVMILLGISLKFFGLNNDIRGWVDAAIGSALINGALIYFRAAYALKNAS